MNTNGSLGERKIQKTHEWRTSIQYVQITLKNSTTRNQVKGGKGMNKYPFTMFYIIYP